MVRDFTTRKKNIFQGSATGGQDHAGRTDVRKRWKK
jgi:hypothetical protein